MGSVRTFGLVALLAAVIGGCNPGNSQDMIYMSADRPPDPAVKAPRLDLDAARRQAEAADQPAQPPGPQPDASRYQPIDVGHPEASLIVRIDGARPAATYPARQWRIESPVARTPVVSYEMAPRLGQFRSATIQVYPVTNNRLSRLAGVMVSAEPDSPALSPAKPIKLFTPAPGLTFRDAATARPLDQPTLNPDAEYELQLIVVGSPAAGSISVRFRTTPEN